MVKKVLNNKSTRRGKSQKVDKTIQKYIDLYKKWGIEPNDDSASPPIYPSPTEPKPKTYWTIISNDSDFKDYPKDWPKTKEQSITNPHKN